MQRSDQANMTAMERLRIALAFAVLECKPEKESVEAFVLKLRRARITHELGHSNREDPKLKPCQADKQHTESQKDLLSEDLRLASAQIAHLEQEVKVLKRKLVTAETDLMLKTTTVHDRSMSAIAIHSPLKKSNQSASGLAISAVPTAAVSLPILGAESTCSTVLKQVKSRKSAASTSPPAKIQPSPQSAGAKSIPLGNQRVQSKRLIYVNKGTSVMEGDVEDMLSNMVNETKMNGHDTLRDKPDPQEPFENLPSNVRLLQTLLLPPSVSTTSRHAGAHQKTLLDQSLNVVSQLSQVLLLAFASYSRAARIPQISANQSLPRTSQTDSGNNGQTNLVDPARMIGLVETLASRLIPQILGQLQSEEGVERVIVAVAKGIIKPSIEAITSICAQHPDHISYPESGHDDRQIRTLECVKSLLDCLLQVTAIHSLAFEDSTAQKSSRPFFPFAEVVTLWSMEALCAFIRGVLCEAGKDRYALSPTARQFEDPSNAAIMTLLQIADGCIEYLPYVDSSRSSQGKRFRTEDGQENIARHVKTRLCDIITKLIADIEMEVEVIPAQHLAHGDNTDTTTTQQQEHTGDNSMKGTEPWIGPLWMSVGMKRETMIAICSVAERLMISEYCGGSRGNVVGSVCGWLEELVGGSFERGNGSLL